MKEAKWIVGSRIMHLIIANRIADHFSFKDKAPFLIGGIIPDAKSPKDSSHFFTGNVSDYSRRIDFNGFLKKYATYLHSPFILGYYTHLIADDIWLKGFFLPWLKNRLEHDQNIHSQYYSDFQLLNGKLLKYYGFANDLKRELKKKIEIIELEEVTSEDINHFIPNVFEDMEFDRQSLEEPLLVFTFNQILGYIETSVHKGIMHMETLIGQEVHPLSKNMVSEL
jgi:hypothetical protein